MILTYRNWGINRAAALGNTRTYLNSRGRERLSHFDGAINLPGRGDTDECMGPAMKSAMARTTTRTLADLPAILSLEYRHCQSRRQK